MANSSDQALFRYVHHTFATNGVSLHPLQRTGAVDAEGTGGWWKRMHSFGGKSIDSAPPAAETTNIFPQYVPLQGSPRDPRFMVS